MSINIIAAVNNKGYIGKDGKLLYRLKKDLKQFKELTTNHSVIMGHNTFKEIGKALPNRKNIVISNSKDISYPNVEIKNSLTLAIFDALENEEKVFIIGGESLYKDALFSADNLYITEIDDDLEGDVSFPIETVKTFFNLNSSVSDSENGISFKFNHYISE